MSAESTTEKQSLAMDDPGNTVPAASDRELARDVNRRLAARVNGGVSENVSTEPLSEWEFVSDGHISEDELIRAYVEVSGLSVAEEEDLQNLDVFPEVTYDYLAHWRMVPLNWDGEHVRMAVAAPYQLGLVMFQWRSMFGRHVEFILARRTWIERALSFFYMTSGEDQKGGVALHGDNSEEALRDLAREAPIVRLVNDMFNHALEAAASDIHVEPGEEELAVRFRVDGVLHTVQNAPMAQFPAITSRIKLLAGMNIAERRLPQDGRIDLQSRGNSLDVRVSTVPTMHGESIVLRLLQKDTRLFELDNLGLQERDRKRFEPLINMPHGMILSVGPTGSGKSTTLYCVLDMLNSDTRKIITIEDPVEYQMPGVTQIQVRPQIGLSFANGLRSIVRQDPDVILVGEIRDRETAEIAIHAALTGHLVLSTLHTNDAAGAISRLLEMGMESFLISSALLGVLSQRLVRRICPDCDGSGVRNPEEVSSQGHTRCRTCSGSGYRGRIGIFELLVINDRLRTAINEHQDSSTLNLIARECGMHTLREDGDRKVQNGITTADEVTRVCQLDLTD